MVFSLLNILCLTQNIDLFLQNIIELIRCIVDVVSNKYEKPFLYTFTS